MMSNNKKRYAPGFSESHQGRGFTLVETMFSIAILSMAILVPLSVASNSLKSATIARERIVAISLARDAMEYVRNVRDANRLRGWADWLFGVRLCSTPGNGCTIDTLERLAVPISGSTPPLLYNSVTGLYGHTGGAGWSTSKYTRRMYLTELVVDREVRVTVEVLWGGGFSTKKVELVNHFMKW